MSLQRHCRHTFLAGLALASGAALTNCASGTYTPATPGGVSPARALANLASLGEPALRLRFTPVQLPGGVTLASSFGINNDDAIVGTYVDAQNASHGFLFANDTLTTIDDPMGSPTVPRGIGNSGLIVGEFADAAGNNHGFLYNAGVFTDLSPDVLSGANGVNAAGIVVGSYAHCQYCPSHGYLWNGSAYTTIDVPKEASTAVVDINDEGLMAVIGISATNVYHAFLYDGKTFTNVDVPGAHDTFAEGLNNKGDVSLSWDKGKKSGNAILHGGTYTTFTIPGSALSFVGEVNDKRTIVGTAIEQSLNSQVYEIHY